MTLLAATAAVSRRVSETSSRLEKVRELAEHLRRLTTYEIPIAIAFLSGETRQGKLGVAYAALRSAEGSSAAEREFPCKKAFLRLNNELVWQENSVNSKRITS